MEDLMVSGDELDAELLVTALSPILRIERETKRIRPLAPWRRLSAKGKIVATLLARKGLRARGLIDEEMTAPAEIIEQTGVPQGSVYPALKELFESRPQIVDKDARSRYYVPNWALGDAVQLLEEGGSRRGG